MKKLLCFVFLFMALGVTGCDSKEVSFIKEQKAEQSQIQASYGKILDEYQYAPNGEWTSFENEQKQKVVRYRAKYDVKQFILAGRETNTVSNELLEKIIANAEEKPMYLVVEFTLEKENKVPLPYVGIEFNGTKEPRYLEMCEEDFQAIADNKPLSDNGMFVEGKFYLFYQTAKAVLNSDALKNAVFAQALQVDGKSQEYGVQVKPFRNYYSTLIKYEVTDIENNDKTYTLDCTFKFTVTDKRQPKRDIVLYGKKMEDYLKDSKSLYENTATYPCRNLNYQKLLDAIFGKSAYTFSFINSGEAGGVEYLLKNQNNRLEFVPVHGEPSLEFAQKVPGTIYMLDNNIPF